MDNKYVIGIIIVLILIVVGGIFALGSNNGKQDSRIEILTNDELNVGDNFEVLLTDLNNAPIANEIVNIQIGNDSFNVTTNGDGKAILKTDNFTAGNYSVKVTFDGNDKFNANSTTQNLILKGSEVESQSSTSDVSQSDSTQATQESSSSSSSGDNVHYDSELNVYYNDEGIVVDPDGQHPMEVGSKYQDLVERGKNIGEDGLE